MKIFAIVQTRRDCYGHGAFEDVTYVPRFHPFFMLKEDAINYITANDISRGSVEEVILFMGGCEIVAPNAKDNRAAQGINPHE